MSVSILKSITDENLQIIVNKNSSPSGILTELGLSKTCKFYRSSLEKRMSKLDLSKYLENRASTNLYQNFYNAYSDEERFCVNSKASITAIRHKFSILYPQSECSICKIIPFWEGKGLNLHFDHINGNNKDNRLQNLRWICPNCHSQTETYTGKNRRKIK